MTMTIKVMSMTKKIKKKINNHQTLNFLSVFLYTNQRKGKIQYEITKTKERLSY